MILCVSDFVDYFVGRTEFELLDFDVNSVNYFVRILFDACNSNEFLTKNCICFSCKTGFYLILFAILFLTFVS